LQNFHMIEGVILQSIDQFWLERRAAARGAEGAVAGGPAGAARDLRELRRVQPSNW